jgi:hypothetical protein
LSQVSASVLSVLAPWAAATSGGPGPLPVIATVASAASALIALAALWVALANRATAVRALRLSQRQEDRRTAVLDVSLVQGLSWRPDGGDRWVCLDILAVNPADRDGTIVRADLHVTYTAPGGDVLVVKVPHGGTVPAWPEQVTPLVLPAGVAANGALAGWLVFRLAPGLVADGTIERLDAVLRDSRGLVETVQAWGLRELP